ncbi:MAG TPA: MoaD/ThiS family protein [Nitrososphaeraceae archaeon]|nr:MoaD/ThiS family protein [Nitrososphaeraceae archaeon]
MLELESGVTAGKIDIRLYASIKDLLGSERIEVDWTYNMTAGDLRKKVNELYPVLSLVDSRFVVSINRRAADERKLIQKNDELALLPPISGG